MGTGSKTSTFSTWVHYVQQLLFREKSQSRIGKAAPTFIQFTSRTSRIQHLTLRTKGNFYKGCMANTLLYSCETRAVNMLQKRSFHMQYLGGVCADTRRGKVKNEVILQRAGCSFLHRYRKDCSRKSNSGVFQGYPSMFPEGQK